MIGGFGRGKAGTRTASAILVAILGLAATQAPLKTRMFSLPLPIFMSIRDIENVAGKRLFTREGRFFACEKMPDCNNRWKELYFEDMHLATEGDVFVVKTHLGGRVPILMFHRRVSADITLRGTLANEGSVVKIPTLTMDMQSRNLLLKIADRRFSEQITGKLQEALQVDTEPIAEKVIAKIQKKFPIGWGASCLLLDSPTTELEHLDVKPGGFVAEFTVGLRVSTDVECPD